MRTGVVAFLCFALGLLLLMVGCGGPTTPSLPNYQGTWAGTWLVQSCAETGVAVGQFCRNLVPSNPLSLTLTQNGSTASGTLALGSLQVAASGPVTLSALTLTGQSTITLGTLTLQSWSSSANGTTMGGTFAFTLIPPLSVGIGHVAVSGLLQTVTKIN